VVAVLDMMRLPDKRAVQLYCRDVTITSSDFANTPINAGFGALAPYRYASHFDDRQPPHLWPTEEELGSLANGVGPARGKARKLLSKINNMFNEWTCFGPADDVCMLLKDTYSAYPVPTRSK
jgi:hypothetical protein